jgi:hypothetical protein
VLRGGYGAGGSYLVGRVHLEFRRILSLRLC